MDATCSVFCHCQNCWHQSCQSTEARLQVLLPITQFPKHRHLKSLMAWWDFPWTPLFLLCSKPLPVKSILWAGLEETPNDGCHVIVSSTLHSQTRTFLLEQTCVFWISYYSGWIPFFSCNRSLQEPPAITLGIARHSRARGARLGTKLISSLLTYHRLVVVDLKMCASSSPFTQNWR